MSADHTILPNDDDLAAMAEAARLGAAYRRAIAAEDRHPVESYAQVLARFDGAVPAAGIPASAAIAELAAGVRGGLRAIVSPRFFGWVNGHSHPAGVAADWLTSAWGQNAAGIAMSPAAAAIEAVVARWLLELLHLPAEASVGIVSGATLANTVGLAAARGSLLARAGWDAEAQGLFGAPPIPVLVSSDAHSTVFAALRHLGLGEARVTRIATDAQGRMLPAALCAALADCSAPPLVIGQAGQINTGVSERFGDIVPLVRGAGGWLHVDGAFGLWAQASPAHRHLTQGVEAAIRGPLTGTSGCRRRMIAASRSCAMPTRTARRWISPPAISPRPTRPSAIPAPMCPNCRAARAGLPPGR